VTTNFSQDLILNTKKLKVSLFVAYASTYRIFNAHPVANKFVENPQKTTHAKRFALLQGMDVQ